MSAPNLIQKDDLRGCEPWQFDSFDVPGSKGMVSLTTAAQVEEIHHQARRDGYQAGLKEGRQSAASQVEQLGVLAGAFASQTAELDGRLAQQALDVALEVARRMLHAALEIKPELVLPVVRDAVRSLPASGEARRLCLHPDDAALVREILGDALGAAGWTIVDDNTLPRGGCMVCTAHGEVDGTPPERWRRIIAALGRDVAWLETGAEPDTA